MIKDIHEILVANKTRKIGSAANKTDYRDVFNFSPVRLTTDKRTNKLLFWDWDQICADPRQSEKHPVEPCRGSASCLQQCMYGECKAFLQVVSNGREWILVCSRKSGYLQRSYTHTKPVSLFSLDATGKKATALPASSLAYTEVAHMIALMMDCTCHLLRDRELETIGAELGKAFRGGGGGGGH